MFWLWYNSVSGYLFTYFMEHFLLIIIEGCYISWNSMFTFYLLFCHNLCFLVFEKVIFSLFLLTNVLDVTYLTLFFVILETTIIPNRCFSEEHLSVRKIKFRERHRVDFGTPNISNISKFLDLSNIILSHASQSSHSVHPLS